MKKRRAFKSLIGCATLALLISGCGSAPVINPQPAPVVAPPLQTQRCNMPNTAVTSYAGFIQAAPAEFVQLMQRLPKGADLYNNLTGSIFPEHYIELGKEANYCADRIDFTFLPPPCNRNKPALIHSNRRTQRAMVRALSMANFSYRDIQAGHDHYFAASRKSAPVAKLYTADLLTVLARQGDKEQLSYIETTMAFEEGAVGRLATHLANAYPPSMVDYSAADNRQMLFNYMLSNGLPRIVVAARKNLSRHLRNSYSQLNCRFDPNTNGCRIELRSLAKINRNAPLPHLFSQAALAFMLADTEPKVVGVNLSGVEDQTTSMRDFELQMAVIHYFHKQFPNVNIALNAGELTPCLVGENKTALEKHIQRAIKVGADRINNGVAFQYLTEQQRSSIAAQLQQQNISIATNLSGNAQALGVAGHSHPLPDYLRQYQLPVVLGSGSAGISYTRLTAAWVYAALYYQLDWPQLKMLTRYSLQHSFLPGPPLWHDITTAEPVRTCHGVTPGQDQPTPACSDYLNHSPKAKLQWQHEIALQAYEQKYSRKLQEYLQLLR